MSEQLQRLQLELPYNWLEIHYEFFLGRKKYNLGCRKWIKKIVVQNKIHKVYNQEKLKNLLWRKWAETSYFELAKTRNPITMLRILLNIPFPYWSELFIINRNRKNRG